MINELLIAIETLRGGHHARWGTNDYIFHPYDRVLWKKIARNQWEPETLAWLKKNISPSSIFLDVGAWVGTTSIWAHQCGARVVAMEPDPVAYKRLLFNINTNHLESIFTLQAGLSVMNGNFKISSSRGLGKSMSKMHFSESDLKNENETSPYVAGFDWDTVMRLANIDHVDILKMDIEGGEFHVFPAIVDKIFASKVKKVLLSLHGKGLTDSEFAQLSPQLIEATKKFKKIEDMNGDAWLWDSSCMEEFRKHHVEIVLS